MTMLKALHLCIKKGGRKRTRQYWRLRWRIDTTTQGLYRKGRRSIDTAIRNDSDNRIANSKRITRKPKWKLYGRFKRTKQPQNNAIRTNHIKARRDKTQQSSECRLCGDRDETMNHIISECYNLAHKEYKTRHNWEGKVIHWEMYMKLKFDHTNKWYKHNPGFVHVNDTLRLLWDFDIWTDHLI